MRIIASDVQMDSYARRSEKRELTQDVLTARGGSEQGAQGNDAPLSSIVVGISANAEARYQQEYEQYSYRGSDVYASTDGLYSPGSSKPVVSFSESSFLEYSIDKIFKGQAASVRIMGGTATRPIETGPVANGSIANSSDVNSSDVSSTELNGVAIQGQSLNVTGNASVAGSGVQGVAIQGQGLLRVEQYSLTETEQSQIYNGYGSVQTEDGRTINFGLFLAMDRSESLETSSELLIQSRAMMDPLVINFGSESATLTDRFFEFDLNADGTMEEVASLGSGSGYLMLDKNQNGIVDDGSELFGPQTGAGFGELAQYDSDGNLWIDEGDPIFEQLQIWVQNESGEDTLMSLSEANVGAIYLGSAESDFDLVSSEGIPLGRIKGNGLYLTEQGEVRSVQELDLANQNGTLQASGSVISMNGSIIGSGETGQLQVNGLPELMTGDEMAARIRQAEQANTTTEDAEEPEKPRAQVTDISEALARMDRMREEQRAYGESLSEEEEGQSVLAQLIEALEENLRRSREESE